MGLLKIASKLISPGVKQSPQEVEAYLQHLTAKAQINKTTARPKIAIGLVYTFILGTVIRWVQEIFGVHEAYLITIPVSLVGFVKVVVIAYFSSRGLEKIVAFASTKIKEKKKKVKRKKVKK